MPDDTKEDARRLSRISDTVLTSRSFRRSFQSDPLSAVRAIGVDRISTSELKTIDALADLNDQELDLLNSIRDRLGKANPDMLKDVIGGVIF
jgi:hypothetical protein